MGNCWTKKDEQKVIIRPSVSGKRKDKSLDITPEYIEKKKQEFFNAGGEITPLRPAYTGEEFESRIAEHLVDYLGTNLVDPDIK